MRLSWSFPRLLLAAWLVASCALLEQATGEEAEDVARSLGVSDVHDWDIRSLYRVRFQHITKRPPPRQRHAERKFNLATRWAALKERISDFFPSRHTNPRTVVTFDKFATDFVNVGIVKLAKALDPPKPTPKRAPRRPKKGQTSTTEPPGPVSGADAEPEVPLTTLPTPADVRPKRRVTLLVDLPDFDLRDFGLRGNGAEDAIVQISQSSAATKPSVPRGHPTTVHPFLPEAQMQLAAEVPYVGSAAVAQGYSSSSSFVVVIACSLLVCLLSVRLGADVLRFA